MHKTEALSIVGRGRTGTVTARAIEGHVVIEMTVDVNLDASKGRASCAAIVDTAACESVEGAV